MKAIQSFAAAVLGAAVLSTPAAAQVSDDFVKVGVLTDMSGVTADITGKGSVVAAEMAVQEFGGTVLGKPIQVISADHQHKTDGHWPTKGERVGSRGHEHGAARDQKLAQPQELQARQRRADELDRQQHERGERAKPTAPRCPALQL